MDTEEALSKRRATFAKFAKRHQARLQKVQEVASDLETSKEWLSGAKEGQHEAEKLAYTKKYTAEYEVDHQEDNNQENISSATSEISTRDTVVSLRSARGRLFRNRMVAPNSVADFELTSTIQPPSILTHSEDYTSNVSVEDLRKTYFRNYRASNDLPIASNRNYLINSINTYSVVMISGATGCGKTTQVPTYILEDAILSGKQTRAPVIYVTQPRRIAARSIARRVCQEHNWDIGSIVGYQVGLDKKVGPDTILIFCTAGVLLQKLITEKSLKSFSHIIVDEAHERDSDTDLLLMFIRLLMRKEMSYFRLIVMSATMEMTKLKNYFTFKTSYGHRAVTTPAVVKIDGKEPNDIQIIYMDKIQSTFGVEITVPHFEYDVPELHDDCLQAAYKIIVDVIPHLDTFSGATESTLVFLPGLAEISKLHSMLKKAEEHLDIIPLHSCLSPLDHDRVFLDSEAGKRKVILSTNIAESSITVKDAGFIVDFCLTKALLKDSITNFPALTLQWSTDDKSRQRAGRTGRCCPGKVFRLVTEAFFKGFEPYAIPELLLAPLELSVLRVKNFQMGEVKALLAIVLDPPPITDIRTAVLELKQIGALSSTHEGKISDTDGDMTELGEVIVRLPIDVHLSKLIVLASVLDVLEDAIIVAACLSTNRTVVRHLYGNKPETYKMKLEWAKGSFSDLCISLDVYKEYVSQKNLNKGHEYMIRYCNNKNLDEKKLHEVTTLVEDIKFRLDQQDVNITIQDQPNKTRNFYEDELMLKIAFCASFYPNYFLSKEMDVDDIKRSLCGLDPAKTVIVHGLPCNQVPLYRSQVLAQVRGLKKGERNFDHKIVLENDIEYIADTSRAMLVFGDTQKMLTDEVGSKAVGIHQVIQPSRAIDQSIYLTLKLGECDRYFVREYRENKAMDRMNYYKRQIDQIPSNGRLLPAWTKIVSGRPADNRRWSEAENEIGSIDENYYVEVEFNEQQDQLDLGELYALEDSERKVNAGKINPPINEHQLFKKEYRMIKGPTSPIQMAFRSILEKSKGYKVEVDHLSVNSILLNPDYTQPRRQMLVAAAVSHSKKNRLMAVDTTLMPNIRGLPTLMSLLFAQYYRIVYDQSMSCIAGGIFGIGWDEHDIPIDRSYEVELGFDIQITNNDVALINKARKMISELIKKQVKNPGAPRAEMQKTLRKVILSLLMTRRFPLQEVSIGSIDWTSDRYFKDKHNVPEDQLTNLEEGQTRAFLPIMEITKDYDEFDLYKAIRQNLDYMDAIENRQIMPPKEAVRCFLCGQGNSFLIYHQIVAHINCEAHIMRLQNFEIQEEKARLNTRMEHVTI